jgi:translation elongation factor EF-G
MAKNKNFIISTVMNSWLPLNRAIYRSIISYLPSPIEAQTTRL